MARLMTSDADLDKGLRIRRDHGMSRERKYVHEVMGFNYRMTNMQAAIGVAFNKSKKDSVGCKLTRFRRVAADR